MVAGPSHSGQRMDQHGIPSSVSYPPSHRPESPAPLNLTAGPPLCEEPWDFRSTVYPLVYSAVFLVGLPGNAAALWVFAFRTRARSASTVYMTNLAASDLLLVLVLPFHAVYHALGGHWVFGEAACRVLGVLFYGSMYVSVTSLALVAAERYRAVLHPIQHRDGGGGGCCSPSRRPRDASLACALLWLLHACGAARVLSLEHTARVPLSAGGRSDGGGTAAWRTQCFERHSREAVFASLLGYAVSFAAPLAALLYCYARIALRLRSGGGPAGETAARGAGGPARRRGRRRALRSVRLTVAVFALCYVPFHATRVLELLVRHAGIAAASGGHCGLLAAATAAHRVALALSVANASLDPVVYYCTASSFRRELRQMFRRCRAPRRAT